MGSNFHFVLYPTNQKKEINLVCVIRKKIENRSKPKSETTKPNKDKKNNKRSKKNRVKNK